LDILEVTAVCAIQLLTPQQGMLILNTLIKQIAKRYTYTEGLAQCF
jgi:hypothetical protein